ncbi:MAG: citrate synthase [Acidimicrobiales bacterium]
MTGSLTARQAADRLGVELATVYAYASRGVLTRHAGPDGRSSRYDHDEVEALVRRARPRSARRRTGGVDVVIGTTVSEIGDGWIRYRGHDVLDLVRSSTFEEVCGLLWTGRLEAPAVDGPRRARATAAAARASRALPPTATVTAHLAAGAAALSGTADDDPPEVRGALVIDALLAALPPTGTDPGPGASVAARLWARTSPKAASPTRLAALDAALVLLAEHELATSTLAVRVAASTGAGPAECVLAGLGTVSGPLHGRAAASVHQRLLGRAPADRPEAIAHGLGHSVHVHGDPRFAPLIERVRATATASQRRRIDDDLASLPRGERPNVDAALGALGYVAGAERGATVAIFAIARTAGWLAHAYEEADEPPLRFRGRTLYRGPR